MKADRLEEEFSSRRVPYGGKLLLFPPADALELIDRASEEGVPIVGVLGFRVESDGVEPSREHRADFSAAVGQGHGCWVDAEVFIEKRRDAPLVYEVTLGDDPVEAV